MRYFEDHKICVIDDFLPVDDFFEMQKEAMEHDYELVQHGSDVAYKLNTGDIYKTTRKYWSDKPEGKFTKFFNAMNDLNLPGDRFSLMAHGYRAGAEIDWHMDYSSICSYSYYVHSHWEPNWGGNLLVADHSTPDEFGNNLTVFETNHSVHNPGFGTWYAPLPNRLVIIKKVFHKVERVDQAVGSNMRLSFTGFYK
jgi:hypothetical protein